MASCADTHRLDCAPLRHVDSACASVAAIKPLEPNERTPISFDRTGERRGARGRRERVRSAETYGVNGRIVLIEDDPDVVALLKEMLLELGQDVAAAHKSVGDGDGDGEANLVITDLVSMHTFDVDA